MKQIKRKAISLTIVIAIVTTLFTLVSVPSFAKTINEPVTEDFSSGAISASTLTYTESDGITATNPVIQDVPDMSKKAIIWNDGVNSGSIKGTDGEVHHRLNIASTNNGATLTSFSFKVLAVNPTAASGYAAPAYVLLGSTESGEQVYWVCGGYTYSTVNSNKVYTPSYTFSKSSSEFTLRTNNQAKTKFSSSAPTYSETSVKADFGKVFITVTVEINDGSSVLTVSKPETENVPAWEYSVTKALTGAYAIKTPYYAVSSGFAYNDGVLKTSVTDVTMNYSKETDWRIDVSTDSKAAECLSYTAADGVTDVNPIVETALNNDAICWNARNNAPAAGDCHTRINIRSKYNYSPLRSFSFKVAAPDATALNGKAAPAYVILGSTADGQAAIAVGGYIKVGDQYSPAYNYYNAFPTVPTGTCGSDNNTALSNRVQETEDIASEAGNVYMTVTVTVNNGSVTLKVYKPATDFVEEWEISTIIETSEIETPYYAISSGYAYQGLRNSYVTDITMEYAKTEPTMNGSTIRQSASAEEQDIMFGSTIDFAPTELMDGYTPAGYGMILARTSDIKSLGRNLEVGDENGGLGVINSYREYDGDSNFIYCVTISRSSIAGNTGKKYSARSYVKYAKEGAADRYVYTAQVAKSVYGYAKDMAQDILDGNQVEPTYELSGGSIIDYLKADIEAMISGTSTGVFGTATNADYLLSFIYANKDYAK